MGKIKLGAAMLALVLTGFALSGCAGSSNSTACKLYEDAYNQVADATRTDAGATVIRAQVDMLPTRFGDAFDKATGDVAVAMRASVESAPFVGSTDQDSGVAALMDITAVETACAADGAAITLNPLQ